MPLHKSNMPLHTYIAFSLGQCAGSASGLYFRFHIYVLELALHSCLLCALQGLRTPESIPSVYPSNTLTMIIVVFPYSFRTSTRSRDQ